MLMPSIFAENLFDDWFDFPSFRNMDRQLYGRHFAREMKTDVHEHDDHYEERYDGTLQRSFYVGDALTEEDITAKLEHGVLSLNIPKKNEKKLPEKKLIAIEG